MSPNSLEDQLAALMRSALAGDEAAYRDFLKIGGDLVRASARRRIPVTSVVTPEDIVQETLLAVHLKRHTWRQSDPILPWLMSIARYKMTDSLRRQGLRVSVPIEEIADTLAAPADEHALGESRNIERAVDGLSEGQRRVVRAIALEGRSIRDTAAAFEMNETAVRVAFHRGLTAIAARFGRQA